MLVFCRGPNSMSAGRLIVCVFGRGDVLMITFDDLLKKIERRRRSRHGAVVSRSHATEYESCHVMNRLWPTDHCLQQPYSLLSARPETLDDRPPADNSFAISTSHKHRHRRPPTRTNPSVSSQQTQRHPMRSRLHVLSALFLMCLGAWAAEFNGFTDVNGCVIFVMCVVCRP